MATTNKAPENLISATIEYYKAPLVLLLLISCELRRVVEESVDTIGFGPLKAKQQEALEAFLSGKDTFVALPTGYGKSIIYAILPSVFDKIRGIMYSLLYYY